MPFSTDLIPEAVSRYRRERDRYMKLADRVTEICREDVCDQNAIRAQVTFRVKTEKSFEGKLRRFSIKDDRNYKTVDEIFQSIGDLAGVRISAYQEADCERIVEMLDSVFCGPTGNEKIVIDRKDKKTPLNENYYRAIHVQVALPEDQLVGTYDNVGDISCEIQVCTMIAHVWNEIEHDIGYKTEFGSPSQSVGFHLDQLGKLVRQGDICISALVSAHDVSLTFNSQVQKSADDKTKFKDVHDFVSRMRDFTGVALSKFSENSGQLFDLLGDLDLMSPHSLTETLKPCDFNATRGNLEALNMKFSESGVEGLRLDAETSDLMLVALMERSQKKILNALKGRAGRGKGRPSRLHRIAVRSAV